LGYSEDAEKRNEEGESKCDFTVLHGIRFAAHLARDHKTVTIAADTGVVVFEQAKFSSALFSATAWWEA
jgi:hypothetical protein